jgi:hypothetical protein
MDNVATRVTHTLPTATTRECVLHAQPTVTTWECVLHVQASRTRGLPAAPCRSGWNTMSRCTTSHNNSMSWAIWESFPSLDPYTMFTTNTCRIKLGGGEDEEKRNEKRCQEEGEGDEIDNSTPWAC